MKNWIRIFFVCFVLVGGTALFSYQLLNQFNSTLDDLSTSSLTIAKVPLVPIYDKTNKEQIVTSTAEIISTSTSTQAVLGVVISTSTAVTALISVTSTDLNSSFIFPKNNNGVYIGCTYRLSFQLSTTTHSLVTTLFDAGTVDAVETVYSGLASVNEIEPNTQGFDWKVGLVLPGDYYIKASSVDGVDLESNVFTIRKMPKGISAAERQKLCKQSDGLL